MKQDSKLLEYINSVIDLEDEEEYLKVSDIGYVFTSLFGTEKTITGQKVNQMLILYKYQVILEDDELFKYYPTEEFDLFEEVVNEELGYGFIKWHYSIISELLSIDFDKNVEENIYSIKKTYLYNRFIQSNNIDDEILKNELLKIGISQN